MTTGTILLVEDDLNDIFFMERAVSKAGLTAPMQVVRDGQQAIDYLSGANSYADRARYPLPGIVFLDLKLPFVHGFDVLEWIRNSPGMSRLPVVILTSSAEERDRKRAQELGAQAYLVKPPEPASLTRVMRDLNPHAAVADA
jgi:CheY-like chemotaxis protein